MMKQRFLLIVLIIVSVVMGYFVYFTQQYDFKTLDNNKFRFSQLEGSFIVINYFAEWCAPCLKEVPELNRFNIEKTQNTHLFAVSYDNLSNQKLSEIKQKYNMQFPLISEINTQLPFKRPDYLPATYIIKPDGKVKGPLLGEQTANNLLNSIKSLTGS